MEELDALKDRVRQGNDKLFRAWLQIRELVDDKDEWSRQMNRWQEATEKLHNRCQELKLKGYTDYLYLENGKKVKRCLNNPDGFWCQACPSIYPYWETELMEMPSPKVPEPELAAGLVALRTRKFLDSRGWYLWKCSAFGGEVIVVVRDDETDGVDLLSDLYWHFHGYRCTFTHLRFHQEITVEQDSSLLHTHNAHFTFTGEAA